MGLLFCYSVFGRRTKMGRGAPNVGSQSGSSGAREVINLETKVLAADDTAMSTNTEEYNLASTMLKGDEGSGYAMPDFVAECDPVKELSGSVKEDFASEKRDTAEYVLDIEKLSSDRESHQPPHDDRAKSSYEAQLSSYSRGTTLHGEVSLSVGEGTISSDGQRHVMPHEGIDLMGGSFGACNDAYSDYSLGGGSLHAKGFHDDDSSRCVAVSQEFSFGTRYSNVEGAQGVVLPTLMDVAGGEDGVDNAHLIGHQVCDEEERYSRHASDPGFYAREVQKMSPEMGLEGSASPQGDAVHECMPFHFTAAEKLSVETSDERVGSTSQVPDMSHGVYLDAGSSCFNRVNEWVNSIQPSENDFDSEHPYDFGGGNTSVDTSRAEPSETFTELQIVDSGGANPLSLANAVVRSLHPLSTVAHLSGISLRDVPSLGVFSSLRSLNLSANYIAHVPVGCLPRNLHTLDLSRNRIAQIEGFRELTRLRVLNLAHNRISRIGHGLANCTLIKELSLSGNKIGEVEGLHRLLKLAVLNLSFNKVTTSKALGQLAANYGSLLALNLIGNPILTNFSEDQLRKLVTTLVPHVAYLNRQPIKAISVREAALDSVARAALGTSQRHAKTRDIKAGRKAPGALISTSKKKLPPHQHTRASEKKVATTSSSGHHHHHGKGSGKVEGDHKLLLGAPQRTAYDAGKRSMPRSRSAGVLQEGS